MISNETDGRDVSVIVPARNEEATIGEVVARLIAVFPLGEIIVVDGGTDRTKEIVQDLQKQHPSIVYIHNTNDRGKGHAIQVGIANASRAILVQIDSDLQFLPEELPKLIAPIENDTADFVMGSRFESDSLRNPGSAPLHRSFGNHAMSLYTSILFGRRLTDVLAGVKAWRNDVTKSFQLESDNYSYEVELVAKALRKGWRVISVSVTTDPRTRGVSSVNVFKTGLQLLRDIAYFRFQRL